MKGFTFVLAVYMVCLALWPKPIALFLAVAVVAAFVVAVVVVLAEWVGRNMEWDRNRTRTHGRGN